MADQVIYDVCIVGGGLAGLAAAIVLSKQQHKVILIEKESYPFHRVCGEYISLESKPFLKSLGVDIDLLDLPIIKRLQISSPSGRLLKSPLTMGGFGISRFLLDDLLFKKAVEVGVTVVQNCKALDIKFINNSFETILSDKIIYSKIAIAAIGKRSNLDVKWNRRFISQKYSGLNNYIGVKYHISSQLPQDLISLHNFKNGYCGISKIEENKYCLCYLTTAHNLKISNNSIKEMEENILSKNSYLKEILHTGKKLIDPPVTISQISFDKKELIHNHIIMLGDAAGMITPLCGNGMSMALRSASILTSHINKFLIGSSTRSEMEINYMRDWNINFNKRLAIGRMIQSFFGKEHLTNAFISILKLFPNLVRKIITLTHGEPF